jgi:ABC-type transport system involved in cytochrome c biogenesis permease subunit
VIEAAGLLYLTALMGYGAVTVLYAVGLTLDRREFAAWAFGLLAVVSAAHLGTLGLHLASTGRPPLGLVVSEVVAGGWDNPLATMAWLLSAVTVGVGLARRSVRVVGAFIAPVSLGLALVGLLVDTTNSAAFLPEVLSSAWLPVHTLANYASLSLFALAFASGVVYLVQDGRLKRKAILTTQPGMLKLPALEVLDRVNHRGFALGLAFLTLGILSGTFWAVGGAAEGVDLRPKVVVTLGLWLLYALAWPARALLGWGGRRAAWIAIVGFAGLLVSVTFVAHG